MPFTVSLESNKLEAGDFFVSFRWEEISAIYFGFQVSPSPLWDAMGLLQFFIMNLSRCMMEPKK